MQAQQFCACLFLFYDFCGVRVFHKCGYLPCKITEHSATEKPNTFYFPVFDTEHTTEQKGLTF